ncbi:hypothetical protein C5N99_06125 [Treponema medium]|uniref:hypothetical protein n=1 Tax=Treponema medium TaxID=58231 RepID=UPI001980507C|nr:hypothetical protein [Treponema medium]QSH92183.1 hypothetical protein C5N99_06125 [Treponema medium]
MKKINLRDIICDLCTYIKEGELIKNGIYYSIGAIIAPLEPELWSYYKGLRGEQSLENHFFHIDKEEKQKKAAAVKPKKVPLNDTALFTEIAQVWIIVQTLGYDYDSIYDISLFVESILDAFLEHRLNRKVPYQERTVKLVFDELEILEGDTAAFYRRHTRLLCFLQFYRDDIHRFFSLLNNLIINKAYQDSFIRNVDTKENIDPTKLLPTELNAEEARDMLQLLAHRNNRPTSLSDHKAYNDPSRYYIYNLEAVIWLFNDYFGFEQKEKDPTIFKGIFSISKIDEYKQYFEDALKSLEDKIAEFPALALLLERASRYLTFIDLQRYFPCIHNSEISHDADIYRSLKVAKIENGAQYSWFEASYLNALPNRCFKYDVEDSRPFSNKRMKLLQTMFLGSLWGLLCTQSYIKSGENSEQQKWRELLDTLFRSFSPNSGAAEYATGVLNRLIELCCIKTEMFFDTVDFTALNKSSDFTSNETLLHLYYTVTHFLTEKKYCLLAQLDFTAEMQRRILPIPSKNNKKSKRKIARESKSDSEEIKDEKILAANHNTLKRLDCGFSFLVLRQSVVPFGDPWSNECFLERPNFSFRLWFDSVYEDYNPSTQKEYTDEQKYRNLNKSCIENHFFYSADRNMETHFSLHHAVEAVLEKPKRILYALYDIKQYLERIKPQQPEGSLAVPFLQEKLEHIFSTICLVLFPECPSKSWDAVFDSDGIILEDVAIRFDLLKDFGKEFYTAVKEFLKIMFTGQSNWMEKLDFELLIYLIYITLHLAKHDADQTDDTPLLFLCTEDEQKRWKKTADFIQAWRSNRHSGSQLRDLLPHPYSVFHYQLSDNIQSRNIKQWQSLPVSAIIHLYNGNFEQLPQYLRNMHGIIDDAKQLFELKSIETNDSIIRESYKKIITDRWNNFARKKLRKTETDLRLFNPNGSSYDFSFPDNGFHDESYQKQLIEIDTFKQKAFYVWCYHLKCQIALALSDDGLRIEVFLDVKSKNNLTPIYSVTADCYHLEQNCWGKEPLKIIFEKMQEYVIIERRPFRTTSYSYRNSEEYERLKNLREQKIEVDNHLKTSYRNLIQEYSKKFFADVLPLSDTELTKCETLEVLCKKLNDYFSTLRQNKENREKPSWYCMEFNTKEYDPESYPKDQISVSSRSSTDYPEVQFGIVLSDDGTQMEVYLDLFRKGEDVLFTLPVNAYQKFCDFAYAVHNYVKESTLTYQSPEHIVAEVKTFHTEVFRYCIEKVTEQKKEAFARMSDSMIFYHNAAASADKNTENNTPLNNLRDLLNPNAPEDKFYSFSLNMKGSYQGISTTGKTEEITVPEKPRCVSYSFDIENKDENTRDDWSGFNIHVDVLLKDNNTELELCLFDGWDEQDNKIYDTSYTVPLAQNTLLPKFICALYEYWTCYSNSYYEIIEITREYDGYKYKKPKPRKKEIAKVFTETARNIFGTNAKTESLTLTPGSFKEHMAALEYPEQRIGSSYSEITEVSGIRQLILSTGIDAVHIQLAITLNNSLTELEVYFDAKTDPSEKPLFVVNSTDYQLLASFFAELKAHQVEDMLACKRILDEHRETLK